MDNISLSVLSIILAFIIVMDLPFLLIPILLKTFIRQYADSTPQTKRFLVHYIMGGLPLLQLMIFIFIPFIDEKVIILIITIFIFLCQYLMLLWDRYLLEKICITKHLSKEQRRNMDRLWLWIIPNLYGQVMCINLFIRISGFWPANSIGDIINLFMLVCAIFYIIITGMAIILLYLVNKRVTLMNK